MLVKVQDLIHDPCSSFFQCAELPNWMPMNEAGLRGSAGPMQDVLRVGVRGLCIGLVLFGVFLSVYLYILCCDVHMSVYRLLSCSQLQ